MYIVPKIFNDIVRFFNEPGFYLPINEGSFYGNWLKSHCPRQKQEWSDEDEKIMQTIIKDGDLTPSEINWLKSLRPHWKPSEEQMKALANAAVGSYVSNPELLRELWRGLRSNM